MADGKTDNDEKERRGLSCTVPTIGAACNTHSVGNGQLHSIILVTGVAPLWDSTNLTKFLLLC